MKKLTCNGFKGILKSLLKACIYLAEYIYINNIRSLKIKFIYMKKLTYNGFKDILMGMNNRDLFNFENT